MTGLTRLTYRNERWRAVFTGALETASTTFLLLIAVQHFAAGPTAKALIAAGPSVGMLLAPLAVSVAAGRRWSPARTGMLLSAVGAGCCLTMAALPRLPVFVVGAVASLATATLGIPFLTQIYQDNYPDRERGRLFSRALMIRVAVAAAFSELAGRALSVRLEWFPALLVVYGAAFAGSAAFLGRTPARALAPSGGTHPFRALRYVREDRVFRLTLIAWMLMGFANLMMWPLRVEYLANPRYGLALSAALVALLTGVIPNVARLVLSPLWGWLFDHLNFFLLRVVLNLGFALGIVAFFASGSFAGLVVGAVVFGVANAGGDVAWTLWVTKFAPPERVADYMSVHTFFTGLRGVVAPLVAFHLVAGWSVAALGWLSATLILLSCLLLVGEIRAGNAPDPATVLVNEAAKKGAR